MSITANWSYPTAIRFGAGRISEIADACAAAGIKKPLLVTDRGLASMEITTKTLDLLDAAGLGRAIFPTLIRIRTKRTRPRVYGLFGTVGMMVLSLLGVVLVSI